jgi:hypothetical protein
MISMRLFCLLLAPVLFAAEPRDLFNGRDLAGWVQEGPRTTFAAVDGELRTSGRGNTPAWIHTTEEYENFRLRFEYKLAQWAESAVILRAPRWGRPMQAGLALFLAHDFHKDVNDYITGGVPGALAPKNVLPRGFEKWHSVDVKLDGERFLALIDGALVQDVNLSSHAELRYRLRRGFIGFPDMGYAAAFRNIKIEDLGGKQKYVELFDGSTLNGWQLRGGGTWIVREGAIQGSNGHGVLYADPVFQDFELTMQVRTHNRVNSGVFLRGDPDLKKTRGFEVQIYSPIDSVYPTGSVYGIRRSRISADYEDRWFLLQVVVQGSKCISRIDGETVAETDALPADVLKPGKIGLQIHMEDASVEFRDIRVRVARMGLP